MRGGGEGSPGTARPQARGRRRPGGLRGGGKSASVSCLLRGSAARSRLGGSNGASGCRRPGGDAARCPPPHRLTGSATTRRVPCSPYQAPHCSAAAPQSGHGRHLTPGRGSPRAPHTSHRPANRRPATPAAANQAAGGHPWARAREDGGGGGDSRLVPAAARGAQAAPRGRHTPAGSNGRASPVPSASRGFP